jgi:threonine 3-dehydrogenase
MMGMSVENRPRAKSSSKPAATEAVAAERPRVYDDFLWNESFEVYGSAMQKTPATMLAIRKLRGQPGLDFCSDTPTPKLGPREVLVQVTHAGICGTDPVGRRVCAEGHVGCLTCEPCRTGNGHVCDRVRILGIDTNGGFAQFVAVPEEMIRWEMPCTP